MKGEIVVLFITLFFIVNAYKDNKYTKQLKSLKKYYNILLIGFGGLSFYLFMKKHPARAFSGIGAARELLKSLPVDNNAGYLFDPIFNNTNIDFSNYESNSLKQNTNWNNNNQRPITSFVGSLNNHNQIDKTANSAKTTKRSVSETKKKYVASQQNWKCGHCQNQLNAWFEVDHKHSLETGGTNHVSNLVALCRECHGKKTAMERMGML